MELLAEKTLVSHNEYLEGELHSKVKHEYVAGQVYAMSGASRIHNFIAGNIYTKLLAHLPTHCQVFMSDMKVKLKTADTFYYPDIVVGCELDDNHEYYISQPKIIVEVLSPSTEHIDKREKLLSYKTVDSLQEYIIVSQDKCEIMFHQRLNGEKWSLNILHGNDKLTLKSIGLEISIIDIYARTNL